MNQEMSQDSEKCLELFSNAECNKNIAEELKDGRIEALSIPCKAIKIRRLQCVRISSKGFLYHLLKPKWQISIYFR